MKLSHDYYLASLGICLWSREWVPLAGSGRALALEAVRGLAGAGAGDPGGLDPRGGSVRWEHIPCAAGDASAGGAADWGREGGMP